MIRRTMDAEFLNRVANHSDVRPWLGFGAADVNLQPLLDDLGNVALVTGHGGFVFHQTEPGYYEAHSLFLPEGRGRGACEAARAAEYYLFTRTNAVEIVTKVPANNQAALGLARLAGFQPRFTVKGTFPHADGPVDLAGYGLTWDEWALTANETCVAGEAFHVELEAKKARMSATSKNHDDDPVHDRMAGFCALCVYAGNAAKGIHLYNRWARLAGYAPLALLSDCPVVIDIHDAVLELQPRQEWEMLSCR